MPDKYIVNQRSISDIADAIRSKRGEEGGMTLAEMPEKISTIKTGGGGKTATVTITAPTGSTVYLTDGIETLTTDEVEGVWIFSDVPLGYWTAVAEMLNSTDSQDFGLLGDTTLTFEDTIKIVMLPGGSLDNSISEYAVQYEGAGSVVAAQSLPGGLNPGGAIKFATKSAYGYIPESIGARSFRFSIRFNVEDFNSAGCLLAMHNKNNNGVNLRLKEGSISIGLNNATGYTKNVSIGKNVWHEAMIGFDGDTNTQIVWLDGVEMFRFSTGSDLTGVWTAFKVNNMLAGANWINNHSSASYLWMHAENIKLTVI